MTWSELQGGHSSVHHGLPIADAAVRTGLTSDTLRYYEKDGLMLRQVPRDPSGHRRYGEEDLTWIVMVTRLRSTGMPIRDVRRYAELVRQGDGTEQARVELLRTHREAVRTQLATVQDHLVAIDLKIDRYEASLADGQVLRPSA